jgi:hypothetical protein
MGKIPPTILVAASALAAKAVKASIMYICVGSSTISVVYADDAFVENEVTHKGKYEPCSNESRGHNGNHPMDFIFGGPSIHKQTSWKQWNSKHDR